METSVKYAHYNPGHIDSTCRSVRSDDMDKVKELEDTLLKVYKGLKQIAGMDYVPAAAKEKADFLVLMTNPWDLDGEQVENIEKVSLSGFKKDETDAEEPGRKFTTGNRGLDSVLRGLAESGTQIVGVPSGESITLGIGCGENEEQADCDDCDDEDISPTANIKIKFAKPFTAKDGTKFETGKAYKFAMPASFSAGGETFQWDPDCMDEVSRYVQAWARSKLGEDLEYVYSHGDDYGMDEDDCSEEDEEEPFDGIKGASVKALKKAGSKYCGFEVDHSGNAELTEYCCEGWKDSKSRVPFYVLNARHLIEELCG